MASLGDQTHCYLIRGGWAYRIPITNRLLNGQTRVVPSVFAEQAGLDGDGQVTIRTPEGEPLTIQRRGRRSSIQGLDTPCHRRNAKVRDILFVVLTPDGCQLRINKWNQRPQTDPLERLLWLCGLPVSLVSTPDHAWRELGMAIGGQPRGAPHVAERLEARGQHDLVPLVEEALKPRARNRNNPWPPGWNTILPAEPGFPDVLLLTGGDGSMRVAVGVSSGIRRLPDDMALTGGGLLWKSLTDTGGVGSIEIDLDWASWVRAEHVARHASLTGVDWSLEISGPQWLPLHATQPLDLRSALKQQTGSGIASEALVAPILTPYPETGAAWQALLDQAIGNGLLRIGSDRSFGFVAEFSDLVVTRGSSLADVLRVSATARPSNDTALRLIGASAPPYLQMGQFVVHGTHGVCQVDGYARKVVEAIEHDYVVLGQAFGAMVLHVPMEVADEKLRAIASDETINELYTLLRSAADPISPKEARNKAYQHSDRKDPVRVVEDLRDLAASYRAGELPADTKRAIRMRVAACAEEWAVAGGRSLGEVKNSIYQSLGLDPVAFVDPSGNADVLNRDDVTSYDPTLAPYVSWTSTELPDVRLGDADSLRSAICEIVEVEGPISADRIYRLILMAGGGQRVTQVVRKAINKALFWVTSKDLIVLDEHISPITTWPQRVARPPDRSPVVKRELGPRELYEVPLEELGALLNDFGAGTLDERMRRTLGVYGLANLTQKAEIYMRAADRFLTIDPDLCQRSVNQQPEPPATMR